MEDKEEKRGERRREKTHRRRVQTEGLSLSCGARAALRGDVQALLPRRLCPRTEGI